MPFLDAGKPTIFFDSHPNEQESYVGSYWSSLKSTLSTAWTGDVEKFHEAGTLRVVWYTVQGQKGIRDFELSEYQMVREKYGILLDLPDVRRVLVIGYSGQNPYLRDGSGWGEAKGKLQIEKDKMDAEAKRARERKNRKDAKKIEEGGEASYAQERLKKGPSLLNTGVNEKAWEGKGKVLDIEGIIDETDRVEMERQRILEEKMWEENDGLMSGHNV
jgi:hypothetical protein